MATFKCKICGGDLTKVDDGGIYECLYCGTRQSFHSIENSKKNFDAKNEHKDNLAEDDASLESLLEQGFKSLGDFDRIYARILFKRALGKDSQNAAAYIGLLLCDMHCQKESDLVNVEESFSSNENYIKALQFATPSVRSVLTELCKTAENNLRANKWAPQYAKACSLLEDAKSCLEYDDIDNGKISLEDALDIFNTIVEYADSGSKIDECHQLLKELAQRESDLKEQQAHDEAVKKEQELRSLEQMQREWQHKRKIKNIIISSLVSLVLIGIIIGIIAGISAKKANEAKEQALYSAGNFSVTYKKIYHGEASSLYVNGFNTTLELNVKNNGELAISALEGTLYFYDKNGDLICTYSIYLNGKLESQKSCNYTLCFEGSLNNTSQYQTAYNIYTLDYFQTKICFKITRIDYGNFDIRNYDSEQEITIKDYGS